MSLEMFLVDSSAWISSFRGRISVETVAFFRSSILSGSCATCPVIVLELLQGCGTVEERDELRLQLESLEMLVINHPVWERSYDLGFRLKKKGLSIPTADLLIASAALEHERVVLHSDKHFNWMAKHTDLRVKEL